MVRSKTFWAKLESPNLRENLEAFFGTESFLSLGIFFFTKGIIREWRDSISCCCCCFCCCDCASQLARKKNYQPSYSEIQLGSAKETKHHHSPLSHSIYQSNILLLLPFMNTYICTFIFLGYFHISNASLLLKALLKSKQLIFWV